MKTENAADLVSLVSTHRREHCCAAFLKCQREEELLQIARSSPEAAETVIGMLNPFHEVYSFRDLEAIAALQHPVALTDVETALIIHCAAALYFHENGEGASPWSFAPYDEREIFLKSARVVLGAEDHFRQSRRS